MLLIARTVLPEMLLRRAFARDAAVRPLINRISKSLRFESTTVPSRNAVITPMSSSNGKFHHELKSILGNSGKSDEIHANYLALVAKLDKADAGLLSERLLSYIGDGDNQTLIVALNNTLQNAVAVSDQSLKNISKVISSLNHISPDLISQILLLSRQTPRFIEVFSLETQKNQTEENIGLLVSLWLQQREVHKAADYVYELLENGRNIKATTIELVINNLLEPKNIKSASDILHLVELREIEIYSRTLQRFFEAAINAKDAEVCYSHYEYITRRVYLSRESLAKLMVLISEVGYLREVKKIYRMIQNHSQEPPSEEIRKECESSLAKCAARVHGFRRGFRFLERLRHKTALSVKSYPQFIERVNVSAKTRKVERTLLQRMNYSIAISLKRFYLNLILAKLSSVGRVQTGLEILIIHPKIRRHMDLESIELLVEGIDLNNGTRTSSNVEMLIQLLEHKGRVNLSAKKNLLDSILRLIINSDYWFKVFKIWDLVKLKSYVMGPELVEILEKKSQENGLSAQFERMDCIPSNQEHLQRLDGV